MVIVKYLWIIYLFLVIQSQAQKTSDFLALVNLDKQNITCVSMNSRNALTIVYPMEYHEKVIVKSKKKNFIVSWDDKVWKTEEYLSSSIFVPDPIFDERWEDFLSNSVKLRNQTPISIPLSVRGTGEISIQIKDGLKWETGQIAFKITKEKCIVESLITENKKDEESIKLRDLTWTTLTLRLYPYSSYMIINFTLEQGTEKFYANFSGNFRLARVAFNYSEKNALGKFHNFDYSYTTMASTTNFRIKSTNEETCFFIYVALCDDCILELQYPRGTNLLYISKKGKNLWQKDKQCIRNNNKEFQIYIITEMSQTSKKSGFWALKIEKTLAFKSNSLAIKSSVNTFNNTNFKTLCEQVRCQIIGEKKEIQMHFEQSESDQIEECPSPFRFGPNCDLSCDILYGKSCYGTKLFTEDMQVCSAGYFGKYCRNECKQKTDNTFGQNCRHKCGNCKNKQCDSLNGNCDEEGCLEGFTGTLCTLNIYPILYHPPSVSVIDDTTIKVKVENHTHFGENEPVTYRIEYKINDTDTLNWTQFNNGEQFQMNYNKYITVDNLKARTKYNVRVILMDKYGMGSTSNTVPSATIQTDCKDITNSNLISIEENPLKDDEFTEYTNITIKFKLENDKCLLTQYIFSCGSKQYFATVPNNSIVINELRHYAWYTINVKKNNRQIFQYSFETKDSAPGAVQNLNASNVTQSSIYVSWAQPEFPNGQISKYIVKYEFVEEFFCKSGYNNVAQYVTTNNTDIILKNLQPFSIYKITVKATTGCCKHGVETAINQRTLEPIHFSDTIIVSEFKITSEKNDSIKVKICVQFIPCSFQLRSYCYNVTCTGKNSWDLKSRFQTDKINKTNCTVEDGMLKCYKFYSIPLIKPNELIPYTNYSCELKIFRCENEGSIDSQFILNTTTFQTRPGKSNPVTDPEIYAKDKDKVYFRWKPPYPPHGEIDYYDLLSNTTKKSVYIRVYPSVINNPCQAWIEYVCYYGSALNFIGEVMIAVMNKNVSHKYSDSRGFKPFNSSMPPSPPRNVTVNWDNKNNTLMVNWLHPLYPQSLLRRFKISVGNESDTGDYRILNSYSKYVNWMTNCGTTVNISIYAITPSGNESKPASINYTLPSCDTVFEEHLKYTDSNSILKLIIPEINDEPHKYILILARSKNPGEIQNFDFHNCSKNNYFQSYNKFYKRETYKNIGRCWNITLTENISTTWQIYNWTENKLTDSATIVVDLFYNNSQGRTVYIPSQEINLVASPKEKHNSLILIVIFSIIIIIVIISIIIWYRKKIPGQNKIKNFFKLGSFLEDNQSENLQMIPLTPPGRTIVTTIPQNTKSVPMFMDVKSIVENPIQILDFKQYVKESLEAKEFERQHKLFIRGQTKSWSYGVRPENKPKNRYANLIAYDETRVVLQKIRNDPFSDYINANYIDGYRYEKAYIATQGPKPQTVNDFWRMVWQEKTKFIIMLANVNESGKHKCEQYWPDINIEAKYGNIKVYHENHIVYADYICRIFNITYKMEQRQIEHFHFVSWVDHGVPMYAKSVLPLTRKLLNIPYNNPIVIHCSAGVGRTGSIILSDIVLRMALNEKQVDVLYYLKKIREQRPNLVDNSDQYILVHLIIVEYLLTQKTNILCDKLEFKYEQLKKRNSIKKQMEQIDEDIWMDNAMVKNYNKIYFNEAIMKQKNRFSTIVPIGNNDSIQLSSNHISEEESGYINAVFIDGYRRKHQFIVTQQPLPRTLGDFWRLVSEQNIKLIVSLNKINPNDQTVVNICPPVNREIYPIPYLKIKYIKNTKGVFYNIITVLVTHNPQFKDASFEDFYVDIIQLKQWLPLEPIPNIDMRDFIQFWQDVHKIGVNYPTILVTCYDGALASGLFTALSFVIEQIDLEHECDIPLAVRTIRHNRTNFVRSETQFRYLYEAAITYVDSFSTYDNFTTNEKYPTANK